MAYVVMARYSEPPIVGTEVVTELMDRDVEDDVFDDPLCVLVVGLPLSVVLTAAGPRRGGVDGVLLSKSECVDEDDSDTNFSFLKFAVIAI